MRKSNRVLFENTVFLYILLASKYVFQLISLAYLTRVLEEERYGVLVFATAYMTYFQTFIDFGFILSSTREIALYREDRVKVEEIFGSTLAAKLILVAAGLGVLLLTVALVPRIRQDAGFLLISYAVPALSAALPDYLFRGLERMRSITVRVVISQVITTSLLFVGIHGPGDYMLYPVFNIAGNLFAAIWTWYYILKKLKLRPVFLGFGKYLDTLKDSFSFFISRIATSVLGPTNVFILGFRVDSAALGLFGAANNLIGAAKAMYSPVSDSLYPYMVVQKNFKLIRRLLLVGTPAVLLGGAFCFFRAEWIITLISGPRYLAAAPYFRALLITLMLAFYSLLLGFPTLGAMGRVREANLSVVIVSLFHILCMFLMLVLDRLSILNACYLTGASEALLVLLRLFWIFKPLKIKDTQGEGAKAG